MAADILAVDQLDGMDILLRTEQPRVLVVGIGPAGRDRSRRRTPTVGPGDRCDGVGSGMGAAGQSIAGTSRCRS